MGDILVARSALLGIRLVGQINVDAAASSTCVPVSTIHTSRRATSQLPTAIRLPFDSSGTLQQPLLSDPQGACQAAYHA